MIVLEGPDNAGKSTLADQLSNALDIPIAHTKGPNTYEAMCDRMLEAIADPFIKIYDRVHIISEQVYGKVIRGKNLFANDEGNRIMDLFLDRKPLIVYCRPANHVILETELQAKDHDTPEHMAKLRERIRHVIAEYDIFMGQLLRLERGVNIIHYDFKGSQPDAFDRVKASCIRRLINER